LREQLSQVLSTLPGCESLSVASTDGLILSTTIPRPRDGELLAAVTSCLLTSCARGLAPYQAGECRALDYRGDRQVLLVRLEGVRAYLVAVLHPGAQAIGLDEPALRAITATIPGTLHGDEPHRAPLFFLERDERCRIAVKHGGVLLGADTEQCDVVVAAERVAARHLLVELVGEGVLATDLDTEHGTRINGVRLQGNAELRPGDRISLPGAGGFTLVARGDDGRLRGARKKAGKKKKKAGGGSASLKRKRG
jgi:predicted regulator of Ras-like GTPase activity (Roadblock/LC7/MglB family)